MTEVKNFLNEEAAAIARAASRLSVEAVEKAIDFLLACRGKVVVMGVGKSGIIAHKLAATFSSTGTAAIFLHGSDILHGDLGAVSERDVAILISNSGETDELLALVPHLRRRKVTVIAIVGRLKSALAVQADAVLDASVDVEAGIYGLAPTSSTAVAMAMGDALALTLMHAKGISAEDYAANHPAGRLGKRLTLRVKDLMHGGAKNPVIGETASWLGVVKAISKGGLGAVSVADSDNKLVGIITDGDVRRAAERINLEKLATTAASEMMTRNPATATPEMLAYDALQVMENRPSQISVLAVINQTGNSVGLLRIHDIIKSGL